MNIVEAFHKAARDAGIRFKIEIIDGETWIEMGDISLRYSHSSLELDLRSALTWIFMNRLAGQEMKSDEASNERRVPMKSREELEQIVRGLFNKQSSFDGSWGDIKTITDALAKVQDGALSSVLPNEECVRLETLRKMFRALHPNASSTIIGSNMFGAKHFYEWLRANMAPDARTEKVLLPTAEEMFLENPECDATEWMNCYLWILAKMEGK